MFMMKFFNALLIFGTSCWIVGCASPPVGMETHKITATVVYADSNSINLAARTRGYVQQARVRGFYDPSRNEIWCPNDETDDSLKICGHELRHLIKGGFHK